VPPACAQACLNLLISSINSCELKNLLYILIFPARISYTYLDGDIALYQDSGTTQLYCRFLLALIAKGGHDCVFL